MLCTIICFHCIFFFFLFYFIAFPTFVRVLEPQSHCGWRSTMDGQTTPIFIYGIKKSNDSSSSHADRGIITFHNILVSIKLDNIDYILYVHHTLKTRNFKLEDYVLCISPHLWPVDGKRNPIFKAWKKQDKMLGCWFMIYMFDEILKQVSRFDTTMDAWLKFEKSFASRFRAKAIKGRVVKLKER